MKCSFGNKDEHLESNKKNHIFPLYIVIDLENCR